MTNIGINRIFHMLILCSGLLLTGCGFHLAGTGQLSSDLDNVSVQSVSPNHELVHLIEKRLKSNRVNVVETDQATVFINVLHEETAKVVLTLDSDGKAREYELVLTVTFDVRRPDDSYMLDEQKISLNRDFVFNKNDLLSASQEEQQLFSEMRSDAAKSIIYRLQTIKN